MKKHRRQIYFVRLLLVGSLLSAGTYTIAKPYNSISNDRVNRQKGNFPVKGKVTDINGDVLPGVTVLLKGTTIGVTTDENGLFSITVPDPNGVLVFSFIGYTPEEIDIANRSELTISLVPDLQSLSEIVVVGYGEVRKSDLTGSVASVSLKELMIANPTSINQGLQGRIAGVMVSKNDGAPGAGISMQIRGVNSFSSTTEPLYVIDGIPFTASGTPSADVTGGEEQSINPLSFLNPQDILSVEILKDASSAAIYGSRGSNGVVMITTKKGQTDKNQVEFNMNFGISEVTKKIAMLNAADYATFQNEAQANMNKYEGTSNGPPFGGSYWGNYYHATPEEYRNGYNNGGTNWQDEIFQKAASSDYTLSFSGGNEKTNYYLSGNLVDQSGTIKNSGYSRYNLRANVSTKVYDWLEVGTNNVFSKSTYQLLKTNSERGGVVRAALIFNPTVSVLGNDTESGFAESYRSTNPYLYTHSAKNNVNTTYFSTASYAELKLLKALKFRQNLGYNYNYNLRDVYYNRYTHEGGAAKGFGAIADNSWASLVSESILSYTKTFASKHDVTVVGATTYQNDQFRSKSTSAKNFPDDHLENNNLGAGLEPQRPSSSTGESALISYLGRVNYGYQGKYLATVSFRRDGSSKFAANNKWANFSSFALAWRASDEAFINNLNLFSNLKFRASYGQTGNQAISSYSTMSALVTSNAPINGVMQSGYADDFYRGPANPNLKWETTAQTNVGVDMGFFQNRLNFTVDLYHKKTFDLLQKVLIPISSGFDASWTNYGNVINKGLEVTAQAIILDKTKLTWDANANISFNRSKIQGLESDQFAADFREFDPFFIQRNGQPIGALYGYVEDGFYDNEAEVVEDPQYSDKSETVIRSMVGEIKYKNLDGTPGIGTGDRVIIGNVNPDYIFGITNNFQFKNFNLNFFVQGVTGNDVMNTNLVDITLGKEENIPQSVWNSRWTPETATTAQWPKATTSDARKMKITSRMIEDGSYIRMKNINLGYTFMTPVKFIESINVYSNVTNLFTITNYSWYDPDVNAYGGRGNGASRGVDMNSYPNSRTYSLGVKCVF